MFFGDLGPQYIETPPQHDPCVRKTAIEPGAQRFCLEIMGGPRMPPKAHDFYTVVLSLAIPDAITTHLKWWYL